MLQINDKKPYKALNQALNAAIWSMGDIASIDEGQRAEMKRGMATLEKLNKITYDYAKKNKKFSYVMESVVDDSTMGKLEALFEGFDKVQYAKDMKRWKTIAAAFKTKAIAIADANNRSNKGETIKVKVDHDENMLTVFFKADLVSNHPMPASVFKNAQKREADCAKLMETYAKRKYDMNKDFEDHSLENGSYFVVMI